MDKYFLAGLSVIAFFIIYNLFLAFGSLEGAPKSRYGSPFFPYLSDKPLTEDGYYMLTVAWNIAEGEGFSYNNGIKTTGVQPLATMVYSVQGYLVQSLGGDKYDFARAVIILASFLQVLFAYLIYRLALEFSRMPAKGLYFLISVCVVLLNFKLLLNFANGLETGLYLILLTIFFLYCSKFMKTAQGIKQLIGSGLISGLLLLCRLDSFIIVLIFYLLLVLNRRIRFSQVAIVLSIAILIYLPWQLYVWNVTGNLLQSSARSQLAFLGYYDMTFVLEQYFTSIIHSLTPILYTGNIRLWLIFPLGIPYIIILLFLYKKYNRVVLSASARDIMKLIAVSFLILIIVFFFLSNAPYFYFRYLAFIMIISLPVIVLLFAEVLSRAGNVFRLVLLMLPVFTFSIQALLYFHSGKSALGITMKPTYVQKNFPASARIGAFQTGALGFYVDNVINLDGKMNNGAIESYKHKSLEQYIDSMKIDVLVDWKEIFMEMLDQQYLNKYWQVYSEDIGDGRTICYVRKKR